MPRESIITVYRSTATDIPTGLTFGELAYSDLNGKLFIGKNDGSSLWVGAGVTDGSLGGNSAFLVPTQSAVKTYVDGVVGGGSVVNTLNATGGAVTITGDGGAITNVQSGGANVIRARLATSGATGVASFPIADFGVVNGAVSLTGNVVRTNVAQTFTASQIFSAGLSGNLTGSATNASALGGTAANSWALQSWVTSGLGTKANTDGTNATGTWPISITGNAATATTASSANQVANALTIGTGLGGAASYNGSAAVTIVNTGVLSLNGLTGARTLTGDGGALAGVGNDTIRARLATTGATGVASFSSTNFDVSAAGVVSVKADGIPNAALVNDSITISTLPVSLGGSLTITGTAGEVDVSASSSTITIGLPNDVTIAGNLTVNGTVVTTNVENFVVEDPLLMLGTGNAADSADLGFFARYDASAKYTGLFRDASDTGKYKLFTGLTVEPTTTVNTGGAGYAMATLVARIDGGTF